MSEHIERLRSGLADRYAIGRELASGGMGTVYLAGDLKHGREVALKVLRPEMGAVLGAERFLREIRTIATLTHPHILPLYDSGEVEGCLFYVMPYVQGESLRQRLDRERRLPVGEAVRLAREVADGLAHAHEQGIVHRDIKPENILFSGGHGIVADFGIARAVEEAAGDRLTASGLVVGTPAYMSPEQALGDSRLDGRSDVYSLACVLYEMLAGEVPFDGPDPRSILARKTGERPRSLTRVRESVPRALEDVVTRALMPEPADRFGSAREFAGALADAVTPATPIHATPLPVSEPGAMSRRGRPPRAGLAAAALAVVALAVGAWWILRGAPERGGASDRTASAGSGTGIVVVPFRVVGMDEDLWREGMVDVLSTNLDGLGDLRKIDPRVVLANWRREFGAGTDVPEITDVLGLARDVGAGYAVVGRLVSLEGTATLSADVYDARDGAILGAVEAAGTPDDVTFLANQATLQILDIAGGASMAIGDLSLDRLTRSGPALREYLRGEQSARRFDWDEALQHFDRAVVEDSAFGLALYRASLGCEWERCPRADVYRDLALRMSDPLAERDRAILNAHVRRNRSDPGAIAALESVVARFPDEVAAWYELGEAYFHLGSWILVSWDRFQASFRRALDLDPGFVTAYAHLFTDDFVRGDSAALMRSLRAHREIDTTSIAFRAAELAATVMWGDSSSRFLALEKLEDESPEFMADLGVYALTNPTLGEALPSDRFFGVERVLVSAHAGRPEAAWLAAANPNGPWGAARLRLLLRLRGLPSGHDTGDLVTALRDDPDPWTRLLLGVLAAREGRWPDARREVERLEAAARDMEPGSYGAAAIPALAAWLEARGGGDSVAVEALKGVLEDASGFGTTTLPEYITTYLVHEVLRQEVGRLLLASGRLAEAGVYFESLRYPIWGVNPGLAEACLGEVFERIGDEAKAALHYRNVARWWANGEPAYQVVADAARDAARRLEGTSEAAAGAPAGGFCERAYAPSDFP